MWALPADKRILLDLLGKDRTGIAIEASQITPDSLSMDSSDELILLWARKPAEGDPPSAIIVRAKAMREFIAWTTAAIRDYRPFTAFFKVVDNRLAKQVLELEQPTLGKFESPMVGLIIGEALTQAPNNISVQDLSLLPCKSTYSFSLARAYALGYYSNKKRADDPIGDAWALARSLTRQPLRKLSDESIQAAFDVIMDLDGKAPYSNPNLSEFVIQACRELFFQGAVKNSWRLLQGHIPFLEDIIMEMEESREKRVRTFENVVKSSTKLDPVTSSFLVGLLASQIGQGTFEHVELLRPYILENQMAFVWYGLCVGLHRDTEVQESYNCLGRRLVRELLFTDHLVSLPKYDISVAELEVCLDREAPLYFRVASHGHISVEIVPGVPAIMRWPISVSPVAEEQRPSETYSSVSRSAVGSQISLFPEPPENNLWNQGEAAFLDLDRAIGNIKTVFKDLGKQYRQGLPKKKGKREGRSKSR